MHETMLCEVLPELCTIYTVLPLPCNVSLSVTSMLSTCRTFSRSIMVPTSVSALRRTSIHFVEVGVEVNDRYYRDVL